VSESGKLCTFSILKGVQPVKIRGKGGGGLTLPNDGGLVQRFHRWCEEQRIYDVGLGGHSGGGSCLLFFDEADIPKIREWLEREAVEDDEKTWERRS
jgi:hypothetical protein